MREQSNSAQEEYVGLRFIHRPASDPTAPLVVLVHGRAGSAQVMWAFERAIPASCAVVSFEAFLPDALGGFSWWDMTSDEPLEPAIKRATDRLSFAIERYQELFALTPRRTVALGFSQGSVLLSASILSGELAVDGLGILAGLVSRVGDASRLVGRPSVFIAHGERDEVISVEKARKGAERLKGYGLSVTYIEEVDVGHKVGVQGTRGLKEWLAGLVE